MNDCPPAIAAMIASSRIAAVVTDPRMPDNPVVACNEAFETLTGYPPEEVLGRNCRFLAGPGAPPLLVEELAAAVRERRPVLAEVPNFKRDGTPFRNAVMISPVFGEDGALEYFLGSQSEVVADTPRPRGAGQDAPRQRIAALPRRQQQVLAALLAGKRNKVLAFELGISERTVKMHRAALLGALEVATTAEAIRFAVEAGWSKTLAEP
jgi:PAS domain S-box-containing protein